MADTPVFDVLSSRLSADERRDLLERIKRSTSLSSEPLFPADAYPARLHADQASRLDSLGLVARLLLFFRRLVSGRKSEEILLADELAELAHGIESRHPGLVDYRRALLLEGMAAQLRILRDGARFFGEVLARSVDKDKGAFIALLASIELPEIHARLAAETDPFVRAMPGIGYAELRSSVLEAWEDILLSLTEEKRHAMYLDLRSLLFLRRLSGYLFDRLLGAFRPVPEGGPAATFKETRDLILELGNLLFSLATPPSIELLEALFVTSSHESLGESGFDAEASITADLAAGAEALQKIRAFNARVPLGTILRLVSGDPDHLPHDLPGGEDWLALFKTYWKERIEARLDEYRSESHYRELTAEIAEFVGPGEQVAFENISREGSENSPPLHYELALVFLEAFHRGPFLKVLNRPLKLILVDGDFYRKDNRIELTDAYDQLLRLHENLVGLDSRMSIDGDIGIAWRQANHEILSLNLKRRKLDTIRRGAEDEAERIIKDSAEAFKCLARIVKGVLKGEAGGRYDSLQNLAFMDGRANREFLRFLEKLRPIIDKALLPPTQLSGPGLWVVG
ncbi:MAG: DUF5312 family protein, partial [Spirochaetota bacterium]